MKRILGALALIALSSFNAFADTSGGPSGATIVVTGDCAGTGRTSIALTCSLTGEIGVTVQAWNAYLDCISALSLSPGTHLLSLGSAGSCTTKSIGADVEAYDADLDALAALSSTGLVKRTGSNAWAFAVAGTDYLAPAAIGTTVEAWNTYLDCIGALTTASSKLVAMGASGACSLKSIGTDVEAWDSDLDAVAALTSPATLISGAAQKSNNLSDLSSASTARTNLGVTATGSDTTYAYRANNGSDFSNLTTFRLNVGLAIGTNVEAWDADLDAIAGLASTAGILKRTGAGAFGLAVANTDYLPVNAPAMTGTGTFVNLTGSGILKMPNNTVHFDDAAGVARGSCFYTVSVLRWCVRASSTAESGSNAGTDMTFTAYDDSGTLLGTWFRITRATGQVTIPSLVLTTPLADAQIASASTWNAKLGSSAIGSTVQAWDTDLDQFAALTGAADLVPYYTAAHAMSTFTCTSTCRSLLDDTSFGAMQTTLGLAIGSNVQAWNTYLDCIGALTTASAKLVSIGATGACSLKSIGVDVQAWDADLDAVAALTSPATLISGAAQKSANLSDLASASTSRTNLGVAIGSNVEGWDADLDALAALGSTAGLLKRTGSGTFGLGVSNTDYLAVSSPVFTTGMSGPTYTSTNNNGTIRGSNNGFILDGPDASYKALLYTISSSVVWTAGMDKVAESSTRTGANYEICEWTNATTFIDCPMTISRATGIANFVDGLQVGGSNVLIASGLGSVTEAWDSDLDALAALASTSGILKRTGAGAFGLAAAGTDYLAPAAIGSTVQAWDADLDALAALSSTAGILKRTGAGTFGLAVAGTDYIAATSGSAIQKASSGGLTAAVSNTDYLSPSSPVFTGSMSGPTYVSTGNVSTVRGGTQGMQIDGVDAKYKELLFDTGGTQVWSIGMDKVAQSSTKSGANFEICDWNNAGTFDQCPMSIARSTGITDFVGLTVGGVHVLNNGDLGVTVQDWSTYLQCLSSLSPSTGFLKIGSVGACSAQTKIHADTNIDNILPLANGGTGGNTPDTAQTGIGIQTLDVTSQFDKTASTTISLEPNTTFTVGASTKWKFRVRLFTTLDATGGIKVRMGLGTATITAAMYHIHATCNTTGLTLADTRLADFTTNVVYTGGCTSVDIDIDGEVSVNGAGTLGTLFAQGSASGTSSILTMSNATWTQRS